MYKETHIYTILSEETFSWLGQVIFYMQSRNVLELQKELKI